MGTKEKLIIRFKTLPSDFTYEEAKRLFSIVGYRENNKGRTSGSRCQFVSPDGKGSFTLHKPHPGNFFKAYMMKEMLNYFLVNHLFDQLPAKSEK